MRIPCSLPCALRLALPALTLTFALVSDAAQTPSAAARTSAGQTSVATNTGPATPEAPKSVFFNPAKPEDGKDPFFPESKRHRPPPAPVKKEVAQAAPPVVEVELELKGISGTPERRLAIINNNTFEAGEQGDVATNVGRIRITCKEIKSDSAEVVVNGQPRWLSLRSKL